MGFIRTVSATARGRSPGSFRYCATRRETITMRVTPVITACSAALTFCLAAYGANSPVADAAMTGDITTVKALIARKADVNAPQSDGATAIQWAAYNNNLPLADTL